VNELFAYLRDTALAIWIREGDAFPWIETIHVIAIVTVAGTIAIVDLRLLGLAAHKPSVQRLMEELLPWTWAAFLIAATTGTLLFLTNAPAYAHNRAFQLKMVMMALAGVNMGLFNLRTRRTMHLWDEQVSPPPAAKIAGLLSLTLWAAIICFGRRIGFTLEHFNG
jgi:hypothetical protein